MINRRGHGPSSSTQVARQCKCAAAPGRPAPCRVCFDDPSSLPLYVCMLHSRTHAPTDREGIHSASYSEKFFDGDRMDAAHNKNVEWLRYPAFWWLYLGALPFLVVLLQLTVMEGKELAEVLTAVHILHNVVRRRLGPGPSWWAC